MKPESSSHPAQASVFRIGRFAVPPASTPAFMDRLQQVQGVIAVQPGCLRSLVLTQTAGPDEFNVVSLVEWASAEHMAAAKSAIEAHQAREGFDPETFRRGLGIRAESAVYTALES